MFTSVRDLLFMPTLKPLAWKHTGVRRAKPVVSVLVKSQVGSENPLVISPSTMLCRLHIRARGIRTIKMSQ